MEAVSEGKGIVKLYGGLQAASGIDPIVRAGEVLSLLAPSGEGKTTAVGIMEGMRAKATGLGAALFGIRMSINLAVALMVIAGSALFPALGMIVARFTKSGGRGAWRPTPSSSR